MTPEQWEGSEIISSFMGWVSDPEKKLPYFIVPASDQIALQLSYTAYEIQWMKWHKDWNWIMFAWNKVRTRFFEENDNQYPEPFGTISFTWQMYTFLVNIDACFAMLVESIKTYNEQKTKQL